MSRTAWALKRTVTGRRAATWLLAPVYCAWSSICAGEATSVVQHPVLGPAPVCTPCRAQLELGGVL